MSRSSKHEKSEAVQSIPFQTFRALPNVVSLPFFFGTIGGLQSGHVEPWIRRRDLGSGDPSAAIFCDPRSLSPKRPWWRPLRSLAYPRGREIRHGAAQPCLIALATPLSQLTGPAFSDAHLVSESPVPWCGRRQNWPIAPCRRF